MPPVDNPSDPLDDGEYINRDEPLPIRFPDEIPTEKQQEKSGKRGKISYFTKKRCERIIEIIGQGNPHSYAAYETGISPKTLSLWLRHGREGVKGYTTFLRRVKEAEAKSRTNLVKIINTCATGGIVKKETLIEKPDGTTVQTTELTTPDWRAALAILERRDPELWSLHSQEIQEVLAFAREMKAREKAEQEQSHQEKI